MQELPTHLAPIKKFMC